MVGTNDEKGKQIMLYDSEDDDPPRVIRALVVDNDDRIRKINEDGLKRFGVETRSVKTGQEAIGTICFEEIYDLILISRILPVMDGIKLTKKLRDMEYPAMIVGVTLPLTRLQHEEFFSAGLDVCIDNERPLTARTLKFILETIPCRQTWKERDFYSKSYQYFLSRGPPSGPGSSSSSKNVSEND